MDFHISRAAIWFVVGCLTGQLPLVGLIVYAVVVAQKRR